MRGGELSGVEMQRPPFFGFANVMSHASARRASGLKAPSPAAGRLGMCPHDLARERPSLSRCIPLKAATARQQPGRMAVRP
jgi:hypothetical protein